MKLYLVYLNKSKISNKIFIPCLNFQNSKYVLYASTTDKKLLKKFLDIRKNIFIIKKKTISNDNVDDLKDLEKTKINIYTLISNEYKINIAMTKYEYDECTYWTDYFNDTEKLFSYLNMFNISCLKNKYLNALGTIAFIALSIIATHEDDGELEQFFDYIEFDFDDKMGYSISCNPLNPYILNDVSVYKLYGKSLDIFINKYKFILKEEI